ncbi:monothiol glutaredoxin, Grx4 family [Oleiphilus sp. HI0071]|jgi:monothiol glutaredoxin|uniref:Grx4 family monothiol glutaredoxin n=1 Tax=unclassified Oleiphilus TaxID=2631174 RepID=UPI0007C2CD65|nr:MULTISPECIES: Grx4 family monothiol glutaredoxin [unclassified Oleiphilus]KZY70160.1 monothiol glutaredoxin, Grx4 family [Oleiphilus sp. HI0065]KZY83372.1 monothiol glutaredoxin, Grx4 family [Oleiphilus sp. HI0071]KZY91043.1 monothiol glutaredoxin, Grx4 family [Oleiphilus sp. HI0073]KZZ42065.1 monothiol glutaredoxin, Grx4 family [Oleiphilus sp. HI0118]KZZ51584.1 monothiol glutaredoxin, Grx4 family [Oleiphilus sp. HI0122]KZZ71207.1 monothiol glutaredoxin, Grx4 family [Oleiphilus sp. HI0130]
MSIMDAIKEQIEENSILLYMKGTPQQPQCGFSARTVQALMACGERFAYINILDNPEIRENLKTYSNWPTFPQLYVKGELVGGCDIVSEMYESGELKELVSSAAE